MRDMDCELGYHSILIVTSKHEFCTFVHQNTSQWHSKMLSQWQYVHMITKNKHLPND